MSVEAPVRSGGKLGLIIVTTHSKDRLDVQPVETLHGKNGELRLGMPA